MIAELHPHASGVPYLRENKNLSMPENLAMTSAYACTPVRTLREVVRRGWGGAGDGVTGNFYARNEIGQPEFFLARILAKNSFDSKRFFCNASVSVLRKLSRVGKGVPDIDVAFRFCAKLLDYLRGSRGVGRVKI